jgi:peptide/nickel transport system permease protein
MTTENIQPSQRLSTLAEKAHPSLIAQSAQAQSTPAKPLALKSTPRGARSLPLSIWVSFIILGLFIICALFADWLAPHNPVTNNLRVRLAAPVGLPNAIAEFPLGTDALGRDLLSRLIYGARVSLSIGFVGTLLGLIIGSLSGILAGFLGGWFDEMIMFLADAFIALPFLVIALTVVAIFGSNLGVLVILASFSGWAGYTRLARGQVLSVSQQQYVLAARSIGASSLRLMLRHLLPNIAAPLIVMATLGMTSIILLESSLSFLGLGIQPPTPAWGAMLGEGRDYLHTTWWLGVFPGIAIMLLTMAISQIGDWLRDLLDPTMRSM